ncbi:hypothetical protein J6590_025916 [Homalodisca vitripennis]|nr:hypothetical protein J6590_025916 [Homalodisca vitripennis]
MSLNRPLTHPTIYLRLQMRDSGLCVPFSPTHCLGRDTQSQRTARLPGKGKCWTEYTGNCEELQSSARGDRPSVTKAAFTELSLRLNRTRKVAEV